MQDIDLAVVVGQSTFNDALADLYRRPALRQSLFQGSVKGALLGEPISFDWAVEELPTLCLTQPGRPQWAQAIDRTGDPAQEVPGAFSALFPLLRISDSGDPATVSQRVEVLCGCTGTGGMLGITPLGVIGDLEGGDGQGRGKRFYRHLVVPAALNAIATALSSVVLPHLEVAGISFGTVELAAGDGRAVAVANTVERPGPQRPVPADYPDTPFCVLLGPRLLQRAAETALDDVRGRWQRTRGSATFGLGRAEYQGAVRVTEGSVSVDPEQLPAFRAQLTVEAWAEASVDPFAGIEDAIKRAGETIGRALESY
ncbi:hypothetical protein ACGFYY_36615 [Streptomyces sp. NPDC048331]|uniref:hypothetical protein n=1 Tax=Streptomyces sp. NPDC048331 TaxID=3365534 RepID=UPI0037241B42